MTSSVSYDIAKLLKVVDNRLCADCSAPLTDPSTIYASLAFGVWICENCASVHHKVLLNESSSNLKKAVGPWTREELLIMQRAKNNMQANSLYERYVPTNWTKIKADASLTDRTDWIRAKYYSFYFTVPQKVRNQVPAKPSKKGRDDRIEAQSTLPPRIVDFFLVLGQGKMKVKDSQKAQKAEDLAFSVDVLDCFPKANSYADTPIPELVGPMVFPQGYHLSKIDHPPFSFTFVLTDINRTKLFGAALIIHELVDREKLEQQLGSALRDRLLGDDQGVYYAPRALTVISHYPFYTLFSKFLEQIYRVSLSTAPLPIERYVTNFMQELPLPPQGRVEVNYTLPELLLQISRPPKNHLPMVDFSYRPLFAFLSVENILTVFTCLCMEMTVCICASNLALLTPVQEALLSLLFPFVWQGCYVPILPQHMIELLDAPVPLLVGLHDSYLLQTPPERRPNSVIFVHLDSDSIFYGSETEDLCSSAQPILSLPKGKVDKLRDKLKKFGGCIHRKDLSVYNKAGYPFPNNEHLIPITAFLSEQGVLSQQKQEWISRADLQQSQQRHGIIRNGPLSKEAVPFRHPVACTLVLAGRSGSEGSSLDSRHVLDAEYNLVSKDEGSFNALEIREAFLRFFVASFMDYQKFIVGGGVWAASPNGNTSTAALSNKSERRATFGKALGFVASTSPNSTSSRRLASSDVPDASNGTGTGGQPTFNRDAYLASLQDDFLCKMVDSQMFTNFLHERLQSKENFTEIRFFDENILAKENRSVLTMNKSSTPFLSDDKDYLRESFTVPIPNTAGISEGARFAYSSFPQLSAERVGIVRSPKVLVESPEMRRAEGQAGRAVLLDQWMLLQKDQNASSKNNGDLLAPTMESILNSARQHYDHLLVVIISLQQRYRCHKERMHFLRVRRASKRIQRFYRNYQRRRRHRLRVFFKQCVKIQATWRMHRIYRDLHRFFHAVVRLQSRWRGRHLVKVYHHLRRSAWKIQAVVLGYRARKAMKQRLAEAMSRAERLVLLLWMIEKTPVFYRTCFYLTMMMRKVTTFLHYAFLMEELERLYSSLGLLDRSSLLFISSKAVLAFLSSPAAATTTAGEPRSAASALFDQLEERNNPRVAVDGNKQFKDLSAREKVLLVEGSDLVRKLRILLGSHPSHQTVTLTAMDDLMHKVNGLLQESYQREKRFLTFLQAEEEERLSLYKTLKAGENAHSRQYDTFYQNLSLHETKKRKQKLSQRLGYTVNPRQIEEEAEVVLFCRQLQQSTTPSPTARQALCQQWYEEKSGPRLRRNCMESLQACLLSLRRLQSNKSPDDRGSDEKAKKKKGLHANGR
eukprot:gene3376-3701_t